MPNHLIPEFNQRLQDFRQYFIKQSNSFVSHVHVSTERFTPQDKIDFDAILAEIKQFALDKFKHFINTRVTSKTTTFTPLFNEFQSNAQTLGGDLTQFRIELQEASRILKQKQIYGQNLLERITDKYNYTEKLKKGFGAFKMNLEKNVKQKNLEDQTRNYYHKKLLQKCFFPWRALNYKNGYQNSVLRQNQSQLRKIHQQFGGIVEVLKQKILDTEELIKIKRVAKSEFAYALSKNLLKTISNLSLEVMSLNQVSAKDQQSHYQTESFLNQINKQINSRLQTVSCYKDAMYSTNIPGLNSHMQSEQPRPVPQQISSSKIRTKKISFA